MDLSKFSLAKEDNENYHIATQHGKSFTVSKSGLSERAHKVVKSLKPANNLDEGGMAVDMAAPTNFSGLQNDKLDLPDTPNIVGNTPSDYTALPSKYIDPTQLLQQTTSPVNSGPSLPPVEPSQQDKNLAEVSSALTAGEQAGKQAAAAQQQASKMVDTLTPGLQQNLTADQQTAKTAQDIYQAHQADLAAKDQALQTDMATGKIDPERFVKNMSTGNKILSTISVMLGGFGAGLTGQRNMALDILNKHIDDDIAAQQADKSNTMNLWKMNQATSQNQLEAALKTKQQYLTGVQSLISAQAAKSGNALQGMAAQQAVAGLAQQKMQIQQQQAILKSLNDPAIAGGNMLDKLRLMQMSGVMSGTDADKATQEAGQASQANQMRGDLEQSFNDISSKPLAGALTPSDTSSAKNFLAGKLGRLMEGRYNEEAAKKQIQAIMPAAFDSESTRQNKLQRMHQLLDTIQYDTPTLQKYHLSGAAPIRPIRK